MRSGKTRVISMPDIRRLTIGPHQPNQFVKNSAAQVDVSFVPFEARTEDCFASWSRAALKRDSITFGFFITEPESAPASFGLSAVLASPYMSAMKAV